MCDVIGCSVKTIVQKAPWGKELCSAHAVKNRYQYDDGRPRR